MKNQSAQVWLSDHHQAARVTIGDLDALQTAFRGELDIVLTKEDTIAVFADESDIAYLLQLFMMAHAPRLRPQSLDPAEL